MERSCTQCRAPSSNPGSAPYLLIRRGGYAELALAVALGLQWCRAQVTWLHYFGSYDSNLYVLVSIQRLPRHTHMQTSITCKQDMKTLLTFASMHPQSISAAFSSGDLKQSWLLANTDIICCLVCSIARTGHHSRSSAHSPWMRWSWVQSGLRAACVHTAAQAVLAAAAAGPPGG